tara:strand:- start:818 stop:1120 length:303 start_codon:yes stop_codon:yes gene_type:complete
MDLNSKEGINKFLNENFSDLLTGINESYGPILMEELIRRIKFTIEEFNEEMSSVFVQLKDKEDKRQKMYMMIKDGNIPSQKESDQDISKDWEKEIDEIES